MNKYGEPAGNRFFYRPIGLTSVKADDQVHRQMVYNAWMESGAHGSSQRNNKLPHLYKIEAVSDKVLS